MVLHSLTLTHLEQIAGTTGTPVYVYSKEALIARCANLVSVLSSHGMEARYSLKANPNPDILRILLDQGLGVDASSPGDIAICRAASVPAERVGYTNCLFTDEDADVLLEYPSVPALGNEADIAVWARRHPGRPFLLRLARPPGLSLYRVADSEAIPPKVGFAPEEVEKQLDVAVRTGLQPIGIHCHLGSEQPNAARHIQALHEMEPWFRRFPQLVVLDLGGGFGISFDDGEVDFDPTPLATAFAAFRDRIGRTIRGVVEPGMYLVGPAGAILTRVIRTLAPYPGTNERRVILDASVNQWMGGSYWNAANPVRLLTMRPGKPHPTWLFGQTCTDVDRFGPPRSLPPLQEGDLLLVGNCGAYAAARQSTFNELPLAPEILA